MFIVICNFDDYNIGSEKYYLNCLIEQNVNVVLAIILIIGLGIHQKFNIQ